MQDENFASERRAAAAVARRSRGDRQRRQPRFACILVGTGPAGLTAAISVLLLGGGQSRASLIPRSPNPPALPKGTRRAERLSRMRGRPGIAPEPGRGVTLGCPDGGKERFDAV